MSLLSSLSSCLYCRNGFIAFMSQLSACLHFLHVFIAFTVFPSSLSTCLYCLRVFISSQSPCLLCLHVFTSLCIHCFHSSCLYCFYVVTSLCLHCLHTLQIYHFLRDFHYEGSVTMVNLLNSSLFFSIFSFHNNSSYRTILSMMKQYPFFQWPL